MAGVPLQRSTCDDAEASHHIACGDTLYVDASLRGSRGPNDHARIWGNMARRYAGAGRPQQSILLNVAAPLPFVRQMASKSHDPFATLAACGGGRIGRTRHNLAGN